MCTLIALHCGIAIFKMAAKLAEIGRFCNPLCFTFKPYFVSSVIVEYISTSAEGTARNGKFTLLYYTP